MTLFNLSIYIPRMNASITVKEVEYQLSQRIGLNPIVRVDFIPVNKKAGFVEVHDKMVKSAFVHGRSTTGDVAQQKILKELSEGGSHRFYPTRCSDSTIIDEEWILTKCTNPIQDTMMNTAQIVENCRLLENKVAEQAETISKLEKGLEAVQPVVYQLAEQAETISKLEKGLNGVQSVVYQLAEQAELSDQRNFHLKVSLLCVIVGVCVFGLLFWNEYMNISNFMYSEPNKSYSFPQISCENE